MRSQQGISVVIARHRVLVLLWRHELGAWVLAVLHGGTAGPVSALAARRLHIVRSVALLFGLRQVIRGLGLGDNLGVVHRLVRLLVMLPVYLLTLALLSLHQQ